MLLSAQTRYIEGLVCKLVEQVHVKKGAAVILLKRMSEAFKLICAF